jgi:uracil-DNA glycosylase
MILQFTDLKYSWDNMTLWQYLEEGHIPKYWLQFFVDHQEELYIISKNLEKEKPARIYPSINQVFRSFIPLEKIKVVVLGQDPYHNGSAVGYCFSVLQGNSINPSLRNIYNELNRDKFKVTENGDLTHWVSQGCFMLNTALTVEKGCADSHTEFWYNFTESVINYVADNTANVVWLLMGAKAHKFEDIVHNSGKIHHIFKTSHPSPFSHSRSTSTIDAFSGSGIFSKINDKLKKTNKNPIKW